MKKYVNFYIIILVSIGFISCEKLLVKPDPKNTPTECFESLWNRVNEKYPFLEYKNINWDSIKTVYEPAIHDNMNEVQLFKVLDSMLYTLKDGHVNLYAPFNLSRNWEWQLGYPENFNFSLLEREYLGTNYYITGPFINQLYSLNNNKKIGYMYYGSFSGSFSDYHLSFVLNRFKETDGLIIDVRNNGGGITNNIYKLVNRFVNEKSLIGKSIEKTGKDHNAFGNEFSYYAEPSYDSEGNKLPQYLNKPIIILTNRSCYSACNSFAGFMSILPNVTLLGDQTGGGGGLPTSYQLPNGWVYRMSTTITTLPNGFNIEKGVPVDIHQDMDPANVALGQDEILEKAFSLFQ